MYDYTLKWHNIQLKDLENNIFKFSNYISLSELKNCNSCNYKNNNYTIIINNNKEPNKVNIYIKIKNHPTINNNLIHSSMPSVTSNNTIIKYIGGKGKSTNILNGIIKHFLSPLSACGFLQ